MTALIRKTLTLLPALLVSAGFAHAEAPQIGQGLPLGPATVMAPLDLPAGSYVVATLSAAHPVTLELMTPQGPYRRLVDAKAGQQSLHFVLPGARAWLKISGGPAELTFERILPPAAQRADAPRVWPLAEAGSLQSPALQGLAATLSSGGDTSGFWADRQAEGTPMVEPGPTPDARIVTFFWRGAARNARLVGGPSNDHTWLQRLGDSDVWFASFEVPDSLRLSYQIAPDVPQVEGSFRDRRVALLATLQADPLNRAPVWPGAADRFNQASSVALEAAPEQPGMTGPLPEARGRIEQVRFASGALGNSRSLQLYHPPEGGVGTPVVLVVFDGERFTDDRAPIPQILDRLVATGRLPPVHAIFVDSIDSATRSAELPFDATFAQVLADEILPLAEARFGLTHDAARTVLAGASYGGLAAARISHEQPQAFGAFLSMSGSFWAAPEGAGGDGVYLSQLYREAPRPALRAWLSAGIYETARDGDHGIHDTSRDLADTLAAQGNEVQFRSYAGGHDYLVWRGALAEGLLALFGQPEIGSE